MSRRLYLAGVYAAVGLWTLVVFPSSLVVTLATGSHRLGHRLHARFWGRMILRTCGVRLRVHGLDRLARDRSYVFMATHGSHFDGYAIAAALPHQWRAVLDAWIRRVPVFGWIGVLAGHVFLDRARAATAIEGLERAAETIRGGISVLIFPEGTFREDAQLRPLKRGGFHLALRAGVPIVPLTIVERTAGTARVVRAIDLYIGAPIETAGLGDEAIPALVEQVRTEMTSHSSRSIPFSGCNVRGLL
jgi:1-acyl-sn-glycerol-3-phosphate acyltransferase